ncbi:MAG: hypothetical protein AAGH67_00735 [Cyanobacteria bacterium P01_H01_bin.162]
MESIQKIKHEEVFEDANLLNSLEYLEALGRCAPVANAPEETHILFVKRIEEIWLASFYLSTDALNLPEFDLQTLETYLVGTQFIMQCTREAVRVSRKTREFLQENLLQA